MKPTGLQFEVIKQQCNSFDILGGWALLIHHEDHISIVLLINNKAYRFSDPDYNVISMQLSKLFQTIKKRLIK